MHLHNMSSTESSKELNVENSPLLLDGGESLNDNPNHSQPNNLVSKRNTYICYGIFSLIVVAVFSILIITNPFKKSPRKPNVHQNIKVTGRHVIDPNTNTIHFDHPGIKLEALVIDHPSEIPPEYRCIVRIEYL